ncbi:Epoxide hydrolase 4 [Wickerhamiella sorbophila]|uniref:Epoxide hydrolase 4 n=1 Tax=Wickerhamiella sorbophila TaxID=45607 RepID=A0A2T0FN89_9ASCO|nr:Epoxide hydrolase 4 [Wickerhamiella sorbophila]PRT56458.1 Epoxide hydrolase 4 [Wickerhamiella sorbophila]
MKETIALKSGSLTFTALSNRPQNEAGVKKFSHLLLLLHGFPDTNATWTESWEGWNAAFPQALIVAPVMPGYERSTCSKMDSDFSQTKIAGHVSQFINQLSKGADVYLIGHDWGAIAAFKTAQLYPDLVTKVVALAIPYLANIPLWKLAVKFPEQAYMSSYMLTMQVPRLYRPKFEQKNDKGQSQYLRLLWEFWSPNWQFSDDQIQHVSDTLSQPDVLDSTTAYYRQMFRDVLRHPLSYKWTVDQDKTPMLLIGGSTDGCMTVNLFEEQASLLGKDRVVIINGAGHFMQRENPDEVVKNAVAFLNATP